MTPLHLAFVTETYPPEINGVAMSIGRMVQGLRAQGHRVDVIRPRQAQDQSHHGDDLTLPGLPLPGYAALRFGLPARGRLLRRWRKERPDVVHVVTEGPLGWSAVSAARRLGIATTSGFHTNFHRYSQHYGAGWLCAAVALYLRNFHRRTAATLVPTQAMAAELAAEGIPGVHVVGRGVDTQLFSPERRSAALRQHWGCTDEHLVCLYVGRLAPEKNLQLAEHSFARIAQDHPRERMVWVGDGPARAALEQRHPQHIFVGSQVGTELAAHYASADLFLFPSLTETYGNVVAEAMASALPVLAYRSAAAAELITSGHNGLLAPPGDQQAFIDGALQLAQLPSPQRQTLGQAARTRTLERSWQQVYQQLEHILRQTAQVRR